MVGEFGISLEVYDKINSQPLYNFSKVSGNNTIYTFFNELPKLFCTEIKIGFTKYYPLYVEWVKNFSQT